MATNEDPKEIAATDKAYEVAAEAVQAVAPVPAAPPVVAKAEPAEKVVPKPAAAAKAEPVKAAAPKQASKPAPKSAAKPAPKSAMPVAAKTVVAKPVPSKPALKVRPKPVTKIAAVKASAPRPVAKVAAKAALKVAPSVAKSPAKPAAYTPKAAKTAFDTAFAGLFTNFIPKDTTMDMNANFSGFQTAMTEAQAKAKAAFEKGTSVLGEVSDFTKGNVEAVVESGKILAEGVQGLGSELVAESRSAFEAMTGDIKELAAAKSPTDFFKLQSDLMRKNFDSAVAYGSKNSEAMLKLVSDVMAPISGRVSIAMEKARTTSL